MDFVRGVQRDVAKIAIAAIGVAALYDILAINRGRPAVELFQTGTKGFVGILATITGQRRPAGY